MSCGEEGEEEKRVVLTIGAWVLLCTRLGDFVRFVWVMFRSLFAMLSFGSVQNGITARANSSDMQAVEWVSLVSAWPFLCAPSLLFLVTLPSHQRYRLVGGWVITPNRRTPA